jgi:hypothetical protein
VIARRQSVWEKNLVRLRANFSNRRKKKFKPSPLGCCRLPSRGDSEVAGFNKRVRHCKPQTGTINKRLGWVRKLAVCRKTQPAWLGFGLRVLLKLKKILTPGGARQAANLMGSS